MKLVLTDVSVFFDLFEVQLLAEFFGMEWEILTTEIIYDEILEQDQQEEFAKWRRSNLLTVIEFNGDEIEQIRLMKTKLRNRSIADKSLLWKAKDLSAPLLTCDARLRKEAEHQKIEVHGSIWVIEKMNLNGVISNTKAIDKLELLKEINIRLPEKRINDLIKKLKQ